MAWASLTLCAALLRAWWCNVRLVYLLGSGNDHSKFALLCGFCGLFFAAAAAALFPAGFFAFDVRAAGAALHAWGGGVAAAVAAAAATKTASPTEGGVAAGGDGVGEAAGAGAGAGAAGISEEDFVALFLPVVAVAAACVTAAAALPAIRFAQVRRCSAAHAAAPPDPPPPPSLPWFRGVPPVPSHARPVPSTQYLSPYFKSSVL